jgi:hypothetical protein
MYSNRMEVHVSISVYFTRLSCFMLCNKMTVSEDYIFLSEVCHHSKPMEAALGDSSSAPTS